MTIENKNKFLRRPRPSKLQRIDIPSSSSSDSDSESIDSYVDLLTNPGFDREITDLVSNINYGKTPSSKSPKEINYPQQLNSPEGKFLYIIDEGIEEFIYN